MDKKLGRFTSFLIKDIIANQEEKQEHEVKTAFEGNGFSYIPWRRIPLKTVKNNLAKSGNDGEQSLMPTFVATIICNFI